jgi:hypothetical protein
LNNIGTKDFTIISNWLGWGDPFGGIWFIGIEEGKPWDCSTDDELECSRNEIRNNYNSRFTKYNNKTERGNILWPVANVSSKIAHISSVGYNSWKSYRDEKLWIGDCKVFNGNILSLGKHDLSLNSWPTGYQDLFGYSHKEYNTYYETVTTYRYNIFRDLRGECNPSAIVCFGMSHWYEFQQVFSLTSKAFDENSNAKTNVYYQDKIILTRHFSNGFPDSTAKFIGDIVHSWVGSIP